MKIILLICLLVCLPFGLKAEEKMNEVNLNNPSTVTYSKKSTTIDTHEVGLLFIAAIAGYLFRRKLLLFRK